MDSLREKKVLVVTGSLNRRNLHSRKGKRAQTQARTGFCFLPRKRTRDERIVESAGLRIAEEEDSCCRRLKILEKPCPLLPRSVVAEGGRALVLILSPESKREEDNPVL
ncbi:hypothetical protein AAC387_Pa04g0485 [Persea americana]